MDKKVVNKNYGLSNTAKIKSNLKLKKEYISKSNYKFNTYDDIWLLDKDSLVNLVPIRELMDEDLYESFLRCLIHYAINAAGKYVRNLNIYILTYFRKTNSCDFNVTSLMNYRGMLNEETEYKLGYFRAFLKRWYKKGYVGVDTKAYKFLDEIVLKGNKKGVRVQLFDPELGPLSDIENDAIHSNAYTKFAEGKIDIEELAALMILSHYGCRPIQISNFKLCDFFEITNWDEVNKYQYNIKIPKAKDGKLWRDAYLIRPMTKNLWDIIRDQSEHVKGQYERLFPTIDKNALKQLPLFPNYKVLDQIEDEHEFVETIRTQLAHLKSEQISKSIQDTVTKLEVSSERTEEALNFFPTRYRYTTGTNAAREGANTLVVAEILGHESDQNAKVYTQNNVAFMRNLFDYLNQELVTVVGVFSGNIVANESDAINGELISKRIRFGFGKSSSIDNVGTCGVSGLCIENAPVACYVCNQFQAWQDAPHYLVYEWLLDKREKTYKATQDERVTASMDRIIYAVRDVMNQCEENRVSKFLTKGCDGK